VDILGSIVVVATTISARRAHRSPFFRAFAQTLDARGARAVLVDPRTVALHDSALVGEEFCAGEERSRSPHRVRVRPAVIYENAYVHVAASGATRNIRCIARHWGVPLFNPPIPNKALMSAIVARRACGMRTPRTWTAATAEDVLRRVCRHGALYVKPIGGSGGRGVLRIVPARAGRFDVREDRSATGSVCHSARVLRTDQVRALLQERLRKRRHLMQCEIPSLRLDGRRVDFRVVTQRDGCGLWQVVGIVGKRLRAGGVVSNLAAGGERFAVADVQVAGQTLPLDKLERPALRCSQALSRGRPTLGVLGFDIALDEACAPYFIEVNAKPARSLLDVQMQSRSGELAAAFALHLSTPADD
jgi:hypothetical protein